MDDSENPIIIEGLAVIALTAFDMGKDDVAARADVLAMWNDLGQPSGVFHAAAAAMAGLP